jgi:hypothetical protein
MPEEVVFQTLWPQDHRPAGDRDVLRMVRVDMKLFADIQALCREVGYYGLDLSTTYHPDLRARWSMLVGSLRRGLAMVDRGSRGKPFDTFRSADARKKVEEIIQFAQLSLGLTMTKGPKVDRINEEKSPPAPTEALQPELLGFVYRPRLSNDVG